MARGKRRRRSWPRKETSCSWRKIIVGESEEGEEMNISFFLCISGFVEENIVLGDCEKKPSAIRQVLALVSC